MLTTERPIVCLVTDRSRLGSLWGVSPNDRLLRQVRAAVAAGVDLIHVRERDLETRELIALVGSVLRAAEGTGTRVVVNDRVDIAMSTGAGVHLRAHSMPAHRARAVMSSKFLIGRSVHGSLEVCQDVDYLIVGSVFQSESKPADCKPLGLHVLTRAVQQSPAPVLAIGGMTLARVPAVAAGGAAGLAAIGLFVDPRGAAGTPEAAMVELVVAIRGGFRS